MTDSIEPEWGEALTLDFNGSPIRAVMLDGVPWYAVDDLPEPVGLIDETASAVDRASFPSYAKVTGQEVPEPGEGAEGRQPVTLVSPVGVWIWTALTNDVRGEKLAAWAKREALRLNPEVRPDNKAVFLQLDEDGDVPRWYPRKYSGRRAEFYALKESNDHLLRGIPINMRPRTAAIPAN